MAKLRKSAIGMTAVLSAGFFAASTVAFAFKGDETANVTADGGRIQQVDGLVDNRTEEYFDGNVVYRLPEEVADDQDISVIISMSTDSVMDVYNDSPFGGTFSGFLKTEAARVAADKVEMERNNLIKTLRSSGIKYTLGEKYDTLLSGFEVTVKASDFDAVNALFEGESQVIVGEVYYPAETQVVTNEVDVYETGIFDSSECDYQGDKVVVAVLDTGCDYTHTAFAIDPPEEAEGFSAAEIATKVRTTSLRASEFTPGLTGNDVYVSKKIPYAYDYADKDPDVAPINEEHGTHVAGIIAGKDDEITGVAPNAQLAIMKVFSDSSEGAKTSWILAALEDSVKLGVDVINMSLGGTCGFSREIDDVRKNEIYDSIEEAGISLIVAAGNDYNSTFGSTKNGNLGLTSNPDSGTVGSPSTYGASLSVASVDGVKTPYIKYLDDIIYFKEATTSSVEQKDFVDDILKTVGAENSYDFDYVTIPGVGRSSDYMETGDFYHNKIVLVKRGDTTFEDKVRVALMEKGAAGIIIYNNVSGSISMSVGKDIGAVCSITQDEGEKLAAAGTGTLHISREQVAGPFMSDFSSWGPTSDLKIKPEITAHGGEIYSCVPGQRYDRLSGTSMAAPNQAGATALVRDYVKSGLNSDGTKIFGDLTPQEVTTRVNQLMMSTADIVYNKNGLAYSVRKQGSGLMNIMSSINSASYITTYEKDADGNTVAMDKTKIELGDDKQKKGVYEMTFDVNNVSKQTVSYDIGSIVMTEGVSTTYTSHGETTVTEDGYLFDDAVLEITGVTGGSCEGKNVSVGAGGTAKVSVKITLSAADKEYLDKSFENGMYVEGFITLTAAQGTGVNLSVPMLAFYGDWTQAPIFDEEYYDTNKDEVNDGIDEADKLMEDAYATRVLGGLYTDYIGTLGSYYFIQDPNATQIAADKGKIAISNKEGTSYATLNRIRSVNAGLLRNCREVDITITEDATGRVVFSRQENNQTKSFSRGSNIYASSVDVDFGALEYDLKNNTKYTVTLDAYIDYGDKADQKNKRGTFTFPLFIDFEAPLVTGVVYRTEYDRTTKKTKLFADISVYDNHYSQAVSLGYATESEDPRYMVALNSFGKYYTPVYSGFNSTSTVTVELTDYVPLIKQSCGIKYESDGSATLVRNNNSFIVTCYDYAMNCASYEISLPDEFAAMYFERDGEKTEEIKLSPNETLDLTSVLKVYPADSWVQTLDFVSSNPDVASVINQTLVAKKSGETTITARGNDKDGNAVSASVKITVLSEDDEGYVGGYSIPQVNRFTLTSYHTNKAYYSVSNKEREIGLTGYDNDFGNSYSLSMFPSESVTVKYSLDSYFPEATSVVYSVGNSRVATVDDTGTIVAQAEGTTIVTVSVRYEGKPTLYSERINITVKDPFTTNSIYLMSYKGLGGTVTIPDDRGITEIYSYAFSNYEYVDKDTSAGDVIDEEDPLYIKQMYIGEDTIKKVIIPEGVETIQQYAFANLTALEEVVLPSSLKKIGVGAFLGCTKLSKVNLGEVQFINSDAFRNCAFQEVDLSSVVAIGNYTFANNKLKSLTLPASSQSLGEGAFSGNADMTNLEFKAAKIKIAPYVFADCSKLIRVSINTPVLAAYAFSGCTRLESVTLGRDVAVIGEYAFAKTAVKQFTINRNNTVFKTENNGADIYEGEKLVLRAPAADSARGTVTITATEIEAGAFAGNTNMTRVIAQNAVKVGEYAFAGCTNLVVLTMPNLTEIGAYAFYNTKIEQTPDLSKVTSIGNYAFARTDVRQVTLPDKIEVGEGAFYNCTSLTSVTIGDDAKIGLGAFANPIADLTYESTDDTTVFNYYYTRYTYDIKNEATGEVESRITFYKYNISEISQSKLAEVSIGANADIGSNAFAGNVKLATLTLGDGATIGEAAFYNAVSLKSVDLSAVKSIGAIAFSGNVAYDYYAVTRGTRTVYSRARNFFYRDGNFYVSSYVNSYFAPEIEEADLSSASEVGAYAFAYNSKLASVKLGSLETIANAAFLLNTSLKTVNIPESGTLIEPNAFYGADIQGSLDLSNVEVIGAMAFENNNLTSVKLKDGALVGDYAFAYNTSLATVDNLDKAVYIGAYSFAESALESVTLAAAEEIGDFAFANSKVTQVSFGDARALQVMGENPFYGCNIETFAKTQEIKFDDGRVIGTEQIKTYEISDNVQIIDDVIYQKIGTGLELVCYPMGKQDFTYTVVDGTARISDCAFAGAPLKAVTIASTVKSVGDKAFYECENLTTVVFCSYYAPILEERYDEAYYVSSANLPLTGNYAGYEGLGISKYYMWTLSSSNNYYFGANFVDYIGHISDNIVIVRPANGQNYDTFIMSQYFGTVVQGAFAATDETLRVMALIDAIPERITLADEAAITAARAAYDTGVITDDQKALVTNYTKLTSAEATLKFLKDRESSGGTEEENPPETNNNGNGLGLYIGLIIAGCALVAICAYVVATAVIKKKKAEKFAQASEVDNAEAESSESDNAYVNRTEQAEEEQDGESAEEQTTEDGNGDDADKD